MSNYAQTVYAMLDDITRPKCNQEFRLNLQKEANEVGFIKQALRQFKGSIAMYMPTDIQVNDSIVYNENTRKTLV